MKLRNRKTGTIKPAEARDDGIYLYDEATEQWYKYELDLLAKWWEYYEELKAWKRLKDKGLRFKDFEETIGGELGDFTIYAHIEPDYSQRYDEFDDGLDLLFGGEE